MYCEADRLPVTLALGSGMPVKVFQREEACLPSPSEATQSNVRSLGARSSISQPNSDMTSEVSMDSSTISSPRTVDADATTVAAVLTHR